MVQDAPSFSYALEGVGFAFDDVIVSNNGAVSSAVFVSAWKWNLQVSGPFGIGPVVLQFQQDGLVTANLTIATIIDPTSIASSTSDAGENSTLLISVTISPVLVANQSLVTVSFSSGSCVPLILATNRITCVMSAMAIGPLYLTLSGAGGSVGPTQVATVVPAPLFGISTNKYSTLSTSVALLGTNFGNDPSKISINFSPSGAASVLSCNSTTVLLQFSSQPAVGLLYATPARSGGSGPTTLIANVVGPHSITDSSTAISLSTSSYTFQGSGFSTSFSEMRVSLAPQGSCTLTGATTTSATCTLSSLAPGELFASVEYAGGLAGPTRIAIVTTAVGVTNSSADLSDRASQVRISGTGFVSAPVPTVTLSTGNCTLHSVIASEIVCNVTGITGFQGELYASVTQGTQTVVALVGIVVPAATLSFGSADLAINAPSFVLLGSYLGTDLSAVTVTLFPIGAVACTAITPSSITCSFLPTQLPELGTLQASVTRAGFTSSRNTVLNIVASPIVSARSTWLAASRASLIIFGSFGTSNASLLSVSLSSGSCAVSAATSSSIDCSLSGSLQLGNLTATVTRSSGLSNTVVVAQVIPTAVLTASSRLLSQSAVNLTLQGSGFSPGSDVSVSLSSGVCSILLVQANRIVCSVASFVFPVGSLDASVSQGGVSTPMVTVSTIISTASLTSRPNFRVAVGTPTLQIFGSGFVSWPDTSSNQVRLSPQGACEIRNSTQTSLLCRLSNLAAGALYAEVTSADGVGSKKRAFVAVAQVLPLPVVSESNGYINLTDTQLTIRGTDFATPATDNNITVIINDAANNTYSCGINSTASAPPALLVCEMGFQFATLPFGVVKVTVSLYGATTPPTSVGVLLSPSPVKEVEPQAVLTVTEGLSPGATAGIAIAIIVAVLVAIIAILLVIRYRMRRNRDILMGAVEPPPPEYASMLTIHSGELTIEKKLGEGSFGAVVRLFCRFAGRRFLITTSVSRKV